jgi:uncharacterized protein (TIGR00730 family)
MKTVTIFCSSLPRQGTAAYTEAERLGHLLAESGLAICNGGYAGLMEATARGASAAGGHTIGVTCAVWPFPPNRWVLEEVRKNSFPERLMTLIERGDGYVVLPGGTGTLAELALTWEMMNKTSLSRTVGGRKPLLVMAPYWEPVITCLKQEGDLGLIGTATSDWRAPAMDLITLVRDVDEAVEQLRKQFSLCGDDPPGRSLRSPP